MGFKPYFFNFQNRLRGLPKPPGDVYGAIVDFRAGRLAPADLVEFFRRSNGRRQARFSDYRLINSPGTSPGDLIRLLENLSTVDHLPAIVNHPRATAGVLRTALAEIMAWDHDCWLMTNYLNSSLDLAGNDRFLQFADKNIEIKFLSIYAIMSRFWENFALEDALTALPVVEAHSISSADILVVLETINDGFCPNPGRALTEIGQITGYRDILATVIAHEQTPDFSRDQLSSRLASDDSLA